MGKYIIHSADELYHYGVKGMKWGVRRYRNADGSLTAVGKKRYSTELQNEIDAEYKKDRGHNPYKRVIDKHPELKKLYNRSNLKQARADRDALEQIEREFDTNRAMKDKYVRIAAKKQADRDGVDFKNVLWGFINEDADQGYSFYEYLDGEYKGGYEAYSEQIKKADTAYKRECRKAVNEFLGKHADSPVKDVYGKKERHDPNLVIEKLFADAEFEERWDRNFEWYSNH